MTLVAPRIVNDASYVVRIKHASHSVGQAQYLVRFEDDFAEQTSTVWYGVVLE